MCASLDRRGRSQRSLDGRGVGGRREHASLPAQASSRRGGGRPPAQAGGVRGPRRGDSSMAAVAATASGRGPAAGAGAGSLRHPGRRARLPGDLQGGGPLCAPSPSAAQGAAPAAGGSAAGQPGAGGLGRALGARTRAGRPHAAERLQPVAELFAHVVGAVAARPGPAVLAGSPQSRLRGGAGGALERAFRQLQDRRGPPRRAVGDPQRRLRRLRPATGLRAGRLPDPPAHRQRARSSGGCATCAGI